jgi:hypothetical protein
MDAFSCFSEASGLKANQTKSSIYFGGVPLFVGPGRHFGAVWL